MSDYTLQVDIRANASSANKEIKGVNNGLNNIKKSASSIKGTLNGTFSTSILKGYNVSLKDGKVQIDQMNKSAKTLKSTLSQVGTASKTVKSNLTGVSTATASTSTSASDLQQAFGGLERVQWFSILANNFDKIKASLQDFKTIIGTIPGHLNSAFKAGSTALKYFRRSIGNTSDFFKAFEKAVSKEFAKDAVGKLKTVISDIGGAMQNLVAALGNIAVLLGPLLLIAGVVTGIVNAVKVAALGDEIKDNAQKVGMTTTAYQEWGYVLKQNGVEISALKTPIRQLNKHITESDGVLQKYGITATTTQEAFEQSISLIQRETDATKKLTMATEIFGARSAELLPVFNLTENETKNLMLLYRELGATQSDELVAAGDKLSDSILHMQTAWQGLKNTLGGVFIPALTKVVQWITVAIAYVNIFIKALMGVKATFGGSNGAVKSSGNIASNLSSGASAAKEMKRQLAGFDELNILSDTSTSGAGTSGVSTDTDEYDLGSSSPFIPEETLEKLQRFKDLLDKINPSIVSIVGLLGAAAIAAALLGPVLNVAFLPLTAIIGGVLILSAGIKSLREAWAMFNETGKVSEEVMQKVNKGIILITVGLGLLALVVFGWPAMLVVALAGILVLVATNKDKIIEKVVELVNNVIEHAKEFFSKLKAGFKEAWTNIKDWAETKFKEFSDSVGNFLSKLGDAWRTGWTNIKDWFSKHIGVIFTAEYWSTKCNNVKQGISTGLRAVGNAIIVKVENMWNNIARKFNDSGIISTLGEVLGVDIKLPTISIPKLASGGIITTPTIAQLGEYSGARSNPEIAAPQSLLESIIQANNSDIISALYGLGDRVVNSVDNKDTNVYLDSTRVSREVTKQQKTLNNLNGSSLVNAF